MNVIKMKFKYFYRVVFCSGLIGIPALYGVTIEQSEQWFSDLIKDTYVMTLKKPKKEFRKELIEHCQVLSKDQHRLDAIINTIKANKEDMQLVQMVMEGVMKSCIVIGGIGVASILLEIIKPRSIRSLRLSNGNLSKKSVLFGWVMSGILGMGTGALWFSKSAMPHYFNTVALIEQTLHAYKKTVLESQSVGS